MLNRNFRNFVEDQAKKHNIDVFYTYDYEKRIIDFVFKDKKTREDIVGFRVILGEVTNIYSTCAEIAVDLKDKVDRYYNYYKNGECIEIPRFHLDVEALYPKSMDISEYIRYDGDLWKPHASLFMDINAKPKKHVPKIKDVIFNAPATIVLWSDGTKTVVKAQGDDEYDPEKGLAMAISKKALGNKREYYHTFLKYLKKHDKQMELDNGIAAFASINAWLEKMNKKEKSDT